MKWFKLLFLLFIILINFAQPNPTTAENLPQRVLIMFADSHDHKLSQEQLILAHEGTIIEWIPSLNTVAAEIPTQQLEQLTNHQAIKYIEQDHIVTVNSTLSSPQQTATESTILNQLAPPKTEPEPDYSLTTSSTRWSDWGTEKIKATQAWQQWELTGQGVKVAVIDTGIATHPDLLITKGVSFTTYTDSFEDDNGHGTHVAGIIAAGQNQNGLRGVAPDAELYAIKVLDEEGNGYHSTIIKGIEWAIEQNVDIINLSVGGTDSSELLKAALDKANNEHGIIIVAAAGNNGYEAEDNSVEIPASYQTVIAVGATDSNDNRGQFSAHGENLELTAPGVRIKSTYLNNSYETRNGTSMAAPHVTGMLALLMQAQPSLSNEQLRIQIRDYTKDLGDPGKDSQYGFGRIEFPAEIEIEGPSTEPEDVNFEINNSEITLSWNHPTETIFNIYRNGEKIQNVSNEFLFTEQLKEGTYTYELTSINKYELESNKTAPLHITMPKTSLDTADAYTDVKASDWFIQSLHQLQQANIIAGYPDQTFRPQKDVTRAELAAMLGRLLQLDGTQRETVFPDVKEKLYASGFIQSAFEKQLITGYPDETFKPEQIVTREEAAVFLARAFPLKKQTTTEFPDVDPSYYSYQSIQLVLGEEIAQGYPSGYFKPKQGVTRAELVTLLSRSINSFPETIEKVQN